jgi:ornithine decarboxylase
MKELGMGFDCASKNEIETVLKLGVDPARIIYAQPCKTKSYVRYAANSGVKQMSYTRQSSSSPMLSFTCAS